MSSHYQSFIQKRKRALAAIILVTAISAGPSSSISASTGVQLKVGVPLTPCSQVINKSLSVSLPQQMPAPMQYGICWIIYIVQSMVPTGQIGP